MLEHENIARSVSPVASDSSDSCVFVLFVIAAGGASTNAT
jgi:hypothetical protein